MKSLLATWWNGEGVESVCMAFMLTAATALSVILFLPTR